MTTQPARRHDIDWQFYPHFFEVDPADLTGYFPRR